MWTLEVHSIIVVWPREFAQLMITWYARSNFTCYVYVAN